MFIAGTQIALGDIDVQGVHITDLAGVILNSFRFSATSFEV